MTPLLNLLPDVRPLRRRFATAVALSALTLAAGAALLASSGYLISKAATRPDVLSLTVVIVAVRFFAIGVPCCATSSGSSRTTPRFASSPGPGALLRPAGAARSR